MVVELHACVKIADTVDDVEKGAFFVCASGPFLGAVVVAECFHCYNCFDFALIAFDALFVCFLRGFFVCIDVCLGLGTCQWNTMYKLRLFIFR